MKTSRTTLFVAFIAAFVLSLALNGGMLLKFDGMVQDANIAQHKNSANTIQLSTVTVVGKRS